MTSSPPRAPAIGFIFVTLLLAVLGFGLIIPVLPGLVTLFEGGDVVAGAQTFGWLVMVFALAQFVGAPILGALSDRFGRRRVLLIAVAGSALDLVLIALAPDLRWLFVARLIGGFTAGIIATANAYIVDITPPEERAGRFGLLGAAFGLGFVLGPAVGGLLGSLHLRAPFWAAAGMAALNWLWGCFVLPESLPPERRRAFSWRRANPVGALLALRQHPVVLGLASTHFLTMIAQTMLQSTWVLYTGYRYGWGPAQVGASLATVGVTSAVVQAGLVRPLLARLGEFRGVALGFSVMIAAYVAYGLAPRGWMIYGILVPGAVAGIAAPALQGWLTRHVPANEQGAVQGAFAGVASLATIIGPPTAAWSFGWAIAPERRWSVPGLPFFVAAAVAAAALALAVRTFCRSARTDPRSAQA